MKACRIILLCLCVGFISGTEAQTNLSTKKINHRLYLLKSQGVDTMICYSFYCAYVAPKPLTPNDSCLSSETHYVFWTLYGKAYKQRFDECRNYPVLSVEHSDFINRIRDSLNFIRKGAILPVGHTEPSKDGKTSQYTTMSVDHTCSTDFEFIIGGETFRKEFRDFDLNTRYMDDDKTPNDNYETNQKSILKRLKDLAEKETDKPGIR